MTTRLFKKSKTMESTNSLRGVLIAEGKKKKKKRVRAKKRERVRKKRVKKRRRGRQS